MGIILFFIFLIIACVKKKQLILLFSFVRKRYRIIHSIIPEISYYDEYDKSKKYEVRKKPKSTSIELRETDVEMELEWSFLKDSLDMFPPPTDRLSELVMDDVQRHDFSVDCSAILIDANEKQEPVTFSTSNDVEEYKLEEIVPNYEDWFVMDSDESLD
jgi:hypothetical protein